MNYFSEDKDLACLLYHDVVFVIKVSILYVKFLLVIACVYVGFLGIKDRENDYSLEIRSLISLVISLC